MVPLPPTARSVALDLVQSVLRRKRPLDETIAAHDGLARLDGRDRAFARLLAATTLRRLGQIDTLLEGALDSPLPAKARGAEDVLRLGTCQLMALSTPPHAAVATAVDLAQDIGQGPYKKLVNAVLRRLDREGRETWQGQDAARLNTPDWLWQSWTRAYGEETCRRIADAHLAEAPLDVSVKADPDAWAERLHARVMPTGGLRLADGGPVDSLAGFTEGAWWVQDAAARLPVMLFGDVAGRTVIDLCAAPGGKTAQLATLGARVTAIDRSENRIKRLRENLSRLGLAADVVVADAEHWQPDAAADLVLLDAPCSATGTIRRHPDVARLKTAADVARLTALQDRLLAAALDMVQRGGTVVYCTCSLEPEEGPERIRALLQGGAPAERLPVTASDVGGLGDAVTRDGDMRTLPFHLGADGGMDGFFAARLRKTG